MVNPKTTLSARFLTDFRLIRFRYDRCFSTVLLNYRASESQAKNQETNQAQCIYLYQKYQDIITVMEDLPASVRDSLRNTIMKFYNSYKIMKNI